jgi:hypothetical protein
MDVEDVDADGVESGTGCVVFGSVDHNMFVKKQKCLGDFTCVTEDGPWLFQNNVVLVEPYDGFMKLEKVELFMFPTWMHIHKLTKGYHK